MVDGPFDKLEAYMTLPVSEYSLLDSSIIRRVSETSFRFQVLVKVSRVVRCVDRAELVVCSMQQPTCSFQSPLALNFYKLCCDR